MSDHGRARAGDGTLSAHRRGGRSVLLVAGTLALAALLSACRSDGPVEPDRPRLFTDREIDAYVTVALSTEFGSDPGVVRKWPEGDPIVVRVLGDPSAEDREELEAVASDLEDVYGASPVAVTDTAPPDVRVHFAPESEFEEIDPRYVPRNFGFFFFNWDASFRILRSRVLIDIGTVGQATREHLIREELTQSMGLPMDTPAFGRSVFHSDFGVMPRAYSPVDTAILRIHGRPEIRPGMDEAEVREVLRGLRR